MEKEKSVEVGNVIVVREHEPVLRMVGVVTGVDDDNVSCIMLTTRLNRRSGEYEFCQLQHEYILGQNEVEVLALPSKEVFA